MENIELWVIGCLFIISVVYYFSNKENKYWRQYYKDKYLIEKDTKDKMIEDLFNHRKAYIKHDNTPNNPDNNTKEEAV